uniref:25-hydroxycholesterol 7-alpha-hydroxylase-like n=1 Tax=Phallusia mammillata TaxID=59560 RepID=A0A6F9DAM1_9ASCI|nr:25-hydroxycholesterol 7-alpha-hydroxylase-like [Phallusia mammillata]
MLSVLTTIFMLIFGGYFLWFVTKRRNKSSEPPIVPYWIPWLGQGLNYQKNPFTFVQACAKKYGPIFSVFMGGRYFTFVTDPFTHPTIAKESRKLNFRLQTMSLTKNVFGYKRGSVDAPTAGGHFPKYMQGENLEDLMKIMMRNLHSIRKQDRLNCADWTEIDLLRLSYDIMFTAGYKSIFGSYSKASGKQENFQDIIDDFILFDDAFPKLVQGYPASSLKGVESARGSFWKMLDSGELDERTDVYAFIDAIRRSYEDRPKDIPKMLFSILWAAESNTVLAAYWALYYVLKHPEAIVAARKEIDHMIDATSQQGNEEIHFTRADFEKMTVLESIVNESLRLGDSPSMLRLATEDYDLHVKCLDKTFRIREGDSVMVMFQLTHMDPEIYSNPEEFKYDRFLTKDSQMKTDFYKDGKPVKFHLQPFGSGLSKCPGRYFAIGELKQFLVLMLRYYDIELKDPQQATGANYNRVAFGTLPPTNECPIRFKRRVT